MARKKKDSWVLNKKKTKLYRKIIKKFSNVPIRSDNHNGVLDITGIRIYNDSNDRIDPNRLIVDIDIKFVGELGRYGHKDDVLRFCGSSVRFANNILKNNITDDVCWHLSYFGLDLVSYISIFRSYVRINKVIWD